MEIKVVISVKKNTIIDGKKKIPNNVIRLSSYHVICGDISGKEFISKDNKYNKYTFSCSPLGLLILPHRISSLITYKMKGRCVLNDHPALLFVSLIS